LADGLTDADVVVCPMHSFTYDLTSGAEVANGGAGVSAYPVRADETGTIRLLVNGAAHPQRNGALSPTT
jgi:nitrite reductase (NADH) small subunit